VNRIFALTRNPTLCVCFEFVVADQKTLSLVNVNSAGEAEGHPLDAAVCAALRWQSCSRQRPRPGRPDFLVHSHAARGAPRKGTDRWAVEHDWASITPLRLDLTDEADLARAPGPFEYAGRPKVLGKRRQRRRSSATSFVKI